jgi:hypothetical protein
MDTRWEMRKVRWLFAGLKLFLLGACLSGAECSYALNGRNATATVTRVVPTTTRWGGSRLTVEYEFTEPDGTRRRDNDEVATGWAKPPNGKVEVRYTPGSSGLSRFAGHVAWLGLGIFFSAILVVIVLFVILGRDARDLDRR